MTQKWPKKVPDLSEKELNIREDWMKYWHSILPNKYKFIENFNHNYSKLQNSNIKLRTLEIGAGLGEHIHYENLENQEYYALESEKIWQMKFQNDLIKLR